MKVASFTLKSGETFAVGDVNVFVGGNGVGKSTLLREIFNHLTQRTQRVFHWIAKADMTNADPAETAARLLDALTEGMENQNVIYQFDNIQNSEGSFEQVKVQLAEYQELERIVAGTQASDVIAARPQYRKALFAFLSPDNRLVVPTESGVTPLNQPAQDSLNVLWRRQNLLERIQKDVKRTFDKHLSLLNHTHSTMVLGLSDSEPPAFPEVRSLTDRYKKVEKWKRDNFEPIQEAGHGIRAMVRVLLGILHPSIETIFVDEPELHLYPRHKRNLGKALVKLAKEGEKQVFLVTHDASLLQGILDASKDATIFRISTVSGKKTREIRRCKLGEKTDIGPTKNQREYLHVLFYDRVVIVEGSTDRTFYEGVREIFDLHADQDIGLVVSSGKSASVNVSGLAKETGVPNVLLHDFDLLQDIDTLTKLNALRPTPADLAGLTELVSKAEGETSKKALKRMGLNAEGLAPGTKKQLEAFLGRLTKAGIWLVPGGELEAWMPTVGKDARFAEIALERIRQDKSRGSEVKDFLDAVFKAVETDLPS